jgi:hypothetical protein
MPVYQYEGKHYDLPDGLSPEQAKVKIMGHLRGGAAEESTNKLVDMGLGAVETLTTGVANAFGGLGAHVAGSVGGMLTPGKTASQGRDEMLEAYSNSAIGKVLAPQTDTGKWVEEKIGHAIEGIKDDFGTLATETNREDAPEWAKTAKRGWSAGMSAMPEASMVLPMLGSRARAQQAPKPNGKGLDAKALIDAVKEPADRPEGRPLDIDLQRLEQAEKPLYADERGVVTPELPDPGMQAAKASLQGAEEVRLGRGRDVPNGERPIYVDPQGQAFRSDPNVSKDFFGVKRDLFHDDPARLALERQGEAMDVGLETKTLPKPPDPLNLLQREQLRASNEGPQMPAGEAAVQHQFREVLKEQSVENHPFVRKAVEKVTKQEELIIKLKEQVQDGRATTSQLVRAVRDLENLETALERVTANVQKGVSEGQKPAPFVFERNADGTQVPFNFKKQGGAVNPAVFDEGFQRTKQFGEYTLEIMGRQWGPEVRIFNKAGEDVGGLSTSAVYGKSGSDRNLSADFVKILTPYQKKGLAEAAYKFLAETGSDIQKSSTQLPPGREMWKRFEEKGLAKDGVIRSPGNKQRGAMLIDPKKENEGKFLSDNPALKLELVPMQLKAADVIEMAKTASDVDQNFMQKAINEFTAGGIYQKLKTHNPVVRFFNERFLEADRLARGDIQKHVHDGLGPATRALNKKQKAEIWGVIDPADLHKLEVTEAQLRQFGANDKQIAYWKTHREAMEVGFEALNRARAAAGKEPIDKRVAYAAMRSTGDFKKTFHKLDENGNPLPSPVGIVSSNARWYMNHRVKLMEEAGFNKENGYVVSEEKYSGGLPKSVGSAQAALAHTLEVLAKDDPRIKEFLKTMDEIATNEAYNYLNMKKHTMDKKGIFGMEGRKQWDTGVLSPVREKLNKMGVISDERMAQRIAEQNAHDGMQSQLDYLESALKFGRLSEAVTEIKPLLSDPTLVKTHPNALKWSENYMKNALGYNPSEMGRAVERFMSELTKSMGLGYSIPRSAISVAKKTVNMSLLALKVPFQLANLIQPERAMPSMKAYLEAKGLKMDFDFGTGWKYLGKAAVAEFKARTGKPLSALDSGAFEYAKSHHVYGSDLVEHSNRASKDFGYAADKVGNFVVSTIESATRQQVFFALVHMLDQNGLKVKDGLYQTAHNATDIMMTNYSPMERSNIYNHGGPFGDASANLSRFKHNDISRLALMARQISEEKTAKPLLIELAAGVAFAGLTGTIAFQEADTLYQFVTKLMGKPDSLTLRAIELSEKTAKAAGAKGNAKYALSHGGFSLLGVDMSKQLGLGNAVADDVNDVMMPGGSKLADIAGATGTAIWSPTEMNAKRMAREVSPSIVASNMDLEWFSKGGMGMKKDKPEALTRRTPEDIMAKRLGFTGINESVEKDKLYHANRITTAYAELREPALKRAADELFLHDKISQETVQAYMKHQGDPKVLAADISRLAAKQRMPAKDRELLRSSMAKSIASLEHAKRLRKIYNENE